MLVSFGQLFQGGNNLSQQFQDDKGRRIIVAWANNWDWMPWFKDWGPTFQEHWCGSYTLPREVRLCADNTLRFIPAEEFQQLRYCEKQVEKVTIGSGAPYRFEAGDGVAHEALLDIDLTESTAVQYPQTPFYGLPLCPALSDM